MNIVELAVAFIFLASIFLLGAAQQTRGSARISLRLAAVWILLPSGLVLCFMLLSRGAEASVGTALSVGGIVVSFAFGIIGSLPSLAGSHPVKVGVIIASRAAFHCEIRKGLKDEMGALGNQLVDLGGDATASREDETGFLRLVRHTFRERLDYAVIWGPGLSFTCETELVALSRSLFRKGGLCIFLENAPPDELRSSSLTIRHNAKEGGELLAKAALANGAGQGKRTLVLLGPNYTEPARLRNDVLRKELGELENVSFLELTTWSEEDAVHTLREGKYEQYRYELVVCPNDSIALAFEDASRGDRAFKWLLGKKVVGFDGLPRARACVAEANTILSATVSIPPSEYGARAGRIIRELGRPSLTPFKNVQRECGIVTMEMTEKHFITRARAKAQLYGD